MRDSAAEILIKRIEILEYRLEQIENQDNDRPNALGYSLEGLTKAEIMNEAIRIRLQISRMRVMLDKIRTD